MAVGARSNEKPNLPKMEKSLDNFHPAKIANKDIKNCRIIGKMLAVIGDEVNTQASIQSNITSAFKTTLPLSKVIKSVNSDALTWNK